MFALARPIRRGPALGTCADELSGRVSSPDTKVFKSDEEARTALNRLIRGEVLRCGKGALAMGA